MLNESLDKNSKQKILKEWEKVTFRIFGMCRKDSRTKVGDYVRLAREIISLDIPKDIDSKRVKNYVDSIVKNIAKLGEDYPANKASQELGGGRNCYEGWEDELIYFFYRYEEHLTSINGGSISEEVWQQVWYTSPTKTIEHIHPQNPDKSWHGKFGVKQDYVQKQAQRLGNLTILPPGVNSKAGNKSFDKKKEVYKNHRNLKLIEEILEKEDWNLETLEEREKRLIAWAEQEWK